MFKKAIVLKVFQTNENYNISTIRKIINELGLENYECIPDFNDVDETIEVLDNILPKSVLCLTLNSNEERKVLICNPMSSSHLQTPIRVGELIWYFKDTTFTDDEVSNLGFLSITHYWHSRISSNINNESSSLTSITQQELDLFSNISQIDINFDNLLNINGVDAYSFEESKTQYNDSLLFQDGNNNIISLNKNIDSSKISIISGLNLEIDDIDTALLNDFSSAISLSSYSSTEDLILINNFEDTLFLKFDKDKNFTLDNNKSKLKSYEDNILSKLRESNSIENNTNIIENNNEYTRSNIIIKSEDINIVSGSNDFEEIHDFFNDEDDEINYQTNNGKIEITRIGNTDQKFNSKILIDEMNDIKIDGETIYVGNFFRNLVSKNIVSDELRFKSDFNPSTYIDTLNEDDLNTINDMCGKGNGVILGYEKNLTEPLVLGNTLVTLLKDMIDLTSEVIEQNKNLVKEIKSMSDEYASHTHPPIPTQAGPQPVNASLNISAHDGFGAKADNIDKSLKTTQERLKVVNKNLKYTLSRFSKTSWNDI